MGLGGIIMDDRLLTNRYMRLTLLGVQSAMGRNGLNAMLRLAGLMRYSQTLPPDNRKYDAHTSEYATLIQTIENHFGNNARGQLTRIGHALFRNLYTADKASWQILGMTNTFLPPRQRMQRSLHRVANFLSDGSGGVTIETHNELLYLNDPLSPGTWQRRHDHELCWLTMGMISECVLWTTDNTHELTEVSCRATGAECCRFEIGKEL
jgi:predicted hydrocarbon binding protein